jgi:hypothetical protein
MHQIRRGNPAHVPVNYLDGRNNNWFSPPAETGHM